MKTATALNLGVIALTVALAPTAFANCGKPDPRRTLSALPAARALPLWGLPADVGGALVPNRQAVVGLWLTTSTIDGQQTQAFEAFTSDGLEFLNDSGSPVEGNVCFGLWQSGPKGAINVTHPSWFYDANGNLIGTAIIKDQFTVDPGANTLHGTITVDIFDLSGNLQIHLAGTYTGQRITG